DIEWDSPEPQLQGRVLLPVLGDEYERVLARNELSVQIEDGTPLLRYFDHRFPLTPSSVPAQPEKISELNGQPQALDALVEKQHYRLAFWRHGDAQVNYRRFFNITTLVGVRVENPQVFQDTHTRILDWYKRGWLDGLRIDHPDGLRDPQAYLTRLREAAPNAWIVVEKILEPGEGLPADWPVAGTTGYDFLNRVGGLFIDPSSEKALTELYGGFTGEPADFEAVVRKKKRRVLHKLLVAEVNQLTRRLEQIAARHGRNFTGEQLREALIELIVRFPVYRTYVRAESGELSDADKARVSAAVAEALKGNPQPSSPPPLFPSPRRNGGEGQGEEARSPEIKTPHPSPLPAWAGRESRWQCQVGPALAFLRDLLEMKLRGESENEFVMRFQQLTGPAMAKGVEDTTFYCFNRFIALNEVGGDPGRFGLSATAFHQSRVEAGEHWPNAMLATSTHDTKRSEDVRARLALLSEIPEEWAAAVRRWSESNEKHRRNGFPDRNAEYFFYQTLVGAWPLSMDRALACLVKASREAKQYTNWTEPNAAYDEALKSFVTATMQDGAFMTDLEAFATKLIEPGQINSLAQTLIKLTASGVPDIYQGNELWDLSLVDPDNRRPVDFAARGRLMTELRSLTVEQVWPRRNEGVSKLWLIQRTLQLRRRQPGWFGVESHYRPLFAQGGKSCHVVAFARGANLVVITPRLVMRLANDWANTTLALPEFHWLNEMTGETVTGGERNVSELLWRFPVALLSRKENN
ncbi:MAG TPA: malto-oligosyltrehalose synthase, partial [Verrucomicrobiae bacterium]|nr:malto-oligosyltrehalose synthase [Verrucomicrobiae bacterium]